VSAFSCPNYDVLQNDCFSLEKCRMVWRCFYPEIRRILSKLGGYLKSALSFGVMALLVVLTVEVAWAQSVTPTNSNCISDQCTQHTSSGSSYHTPSCVLPADLGTCNGASNLTPTPVCGGPLALICAPGSSPGSTPNPTPSCGPPLGLICPPESATHPATNSRAVT